MLAERRREVRHRIQTPAFVSIGDGAEGLILDANARGLALQSKQPIAVCTGVELNLDGVEGRRRIVTAARVAWSDGKGRAGIEFLNLSPKFRGELHEWLKVNLQSDANPAESAVAVESADEEATAVETSVDARLVSAAERAVLLTRADSSAIALNDGHDTRCRALAGEIAPPIGSRIDSQSGLTGACLRSGRVMRCDTDSDPEVDRETCRHLGINSVLAAPIVYGGSVVGLIEVFSRQTFAFDDSDCHALERLAETIANSMTASGWLVRERDNLLPGTAVSTGVAAPSNISADENPSWTSLLVPAGYKFSFTEKLMLHKRAGQWAVAGIVLAASLWLAFGNPSQWRANTTPVPVGNPRVAEQDQTTPKASNPGGVAAAPVPRTQDWLEGVRESAERGDPTAELKLGAAYAAGQDNVQNYTEAVKWLTRSADRGNVTAAASLGAFYWAGRGVTSGYVDAYAWSAIAEAQGDEASRYRTTILRSRMSPVELAEGRRRAAAWLRTHSKQIALRRGVPAYR
jgi:TPR repeat protein